MSKLNHTYTPYQMIGAGNLNVRGHLMPFVQRWPWYLLALVLALVGAYLYLKFQQPIYKIEASLLLQDEKKGNGQQNPLKELEVYSPKKVVENELEVLHSSTLMKRVVTNLHLDVRYYRQTRFGKREIYDESPVLMLVEEGRPELYRAPLEVTFPNNRTVQVNQRTYPLNESIQTPYGKLRFLPRPAVGRTAEPLLVQAQPVSAAVRDYLGGLKTEPTSKTSTVILLTILDAVPKKGEAILNSLINEYNQESIVNNNKAAANTLRFLDGRLRIVSGELSSVERQVENYKSSKAITDLGAQSQAFLQVTQQNDAQLNQVNIKLAALDELEKFVNSQSDKRGSTPATIGLDDPVLLGQIEKLSQLELQRDNMRETTPAEHPMMQTLNNQIKATQGNISQNIVSMRRMFGSTQRQYVAENQNLEGSIRSVPKQERYLLDIMRQQKIKNDLYTYLLQKREEVAVAFAATISDSRTIDAAESSLFPVKPVGVVIYALFALLGLLFPTGVIAGLGALNTRVARRIDVEDGTQVPILGEVMRKRHRDVLVVGPNNRSVIAEQIRTIRTNISMERKEDSQTLLFTSSISGEGKSFISLNLGASLAMLRQPTVILEMDMRKPKLHQVFNIDNRVGISNYLNGEATLADILQPMPGYPNYYIIPSGPLPPDPSELLSGPYLKELIDALREQFRYIIIDAPPVGVVTDAQIVAPLADITLFVVRHGITPKSSLKILDKLYKDQRFQNLNIILNGVGGSESYHFNERYKNTYSYK